MEKIFDIQCLKVVEGITFTGDNLAEIELMCRDKEDWCILTPEMCHISNSYNKIVYENEAYYFKPGDFITTSLEVIDKKDIEMNFLPYSQRNYTKVKENRNSNVKVIKILQDLDSREPIPIKAFLNNN